MPRTHAEYSVLRPLRPFRPFHAGGEGGAGGAEELNRSQIVTAWVRLTRDEMHNLRYQFGPQVPTMVEDATPTTRADDCRWRLPLVWCLVILLGLGFGAWGFPIHCCNIFVRFSRSAGL